MARKIHTKIGYRKTKKTRKNKKFRGGYTYSNRPIKQIGRLSFTTKKTRTTKNNYLTEEDLILD